MAKKFFPYIFVLVPLIVAGVLVLSHNTEAYTFPSGLYNECISSDTTKTCDPTSCTPSDSSYTCTRMSKDANNYCLYSYSAPNVPWSAQDALSFITYGESYSAVGSDKNFTPAQDAANKANIDNLLASPTPRDSSASGLVPCGRECDDPTTAVNEAVPCNFCHIFVLFHNIVNTLLTWALLLAILLVAAGGFLIMVAGSSTSGGGMFSLVGGALQSVKGGPQGVKAGKNLIASALIGYAIMLLAWIIVNVFFSLIGVASWVGIGNWWQPNCPVPGYTQNPDGTWTYHS